MSRKVRINTLSLLASSARQSVLAEIAMVQKDLDAIPEDALPRSPLAHKLGCIIDDLDAAAEMLRQADKYIKTAAEMDPSP